MQLMCQIMCRCVNPCVDVSSNDLASMLQCCECVAEFCECVAVCRCVVTDLGSSPFRTSTHGHTLELSETGLTIHQGLAASRPLRSESLSRFFPMKTILHTYNATANKPSANLLATSHEPCHNSIHTNLHTSWAHNHCQHMQHSSHKYAREIHATNLSSL